MLSHAEQVSMIAEMPGAKLCTLFGVSFLVDYRNSSDPVQFSDGSIEQGKPFCIATAVDVVSNNIDHGTSLYLAGISWESDSFWDGTWFVVGVSQRQDGMYRLVLSKSP